MNTHQRDLDMHQQQGKAAIFSLEIFLTPDDGNVGLTYSVF
jgi:hypothetical protein